MSLSTRSARCAALMAEPDELYPGGNFRRKELTEQRFHLYLFLFFFSRKDYIPQEYENVDQNSCRRRQTNRREDMHGNSLIFLFLFPFEFFKNVQTRFSGSKNVGFRKLCHPTEAGMGEDRIHVATLRAKLGVWIASAEEHNQGPGDGCTSRDAQAFPLQI